MKKILILLSAVLLLSACGSKSETKKAEENKTCDTLNVYNWGEYIDEETLSKFEAEYDVKVNYSLFDSNEAMYTKLIASGNYDVIVPSDYTIERLIKENVLAKLDKNLITNYSLLSKDVLNREFDPNNDYSIPYFWGNLGLVYDKTVIDQKDVETQGWDVLKNPKYAGKIYMYDSERDSFMVAFKALGFSMNTENEEEIQKAYQWLSEVHETMAPAYATDEAIDGLATGEKSMGVMYSGDAATILAANPNMSYFVPTSGTNYWLDGFAIPATSKCQELAHTFINFMTSTDISVANSTAVGYPTANKEALQIVAEEEYKDNVAYLPKPMIDKDETFKYNEVLKEKLSELWIKVKNK